VTNINIAASGLLGYQKKEVIGKKVDGIMPSLYHKHHDMFI
jgi:PAS domain S-box-containing protein